MIVTLFGQVNGGADHYTANVMGHAVSFGRVSNHILNLFFCKGSLLTLGESGEQICILVKDGRINFEIRESSINRALSCTGAIEDLAGSGEDARHRSVHHHRLRRRRRDVFVPTIRVRVVHDLDAPR